jgi:hypothetical protein
MESIAVCYCWRRPLILSRIPSRAFRISGQTTGRGSRRKRQSWRLFLIVRMALRHKATRDPRGNAIQWVRRRRQRSTSHEVTAPHRRMMFLDRGSFGLAINYVSTSSLSLTPIAIDRCIYTVIRCCRFGYLRPFYRWIFSEMPSLDDRWRTRHSHVLTSTACSCNNRLNRSQPVLSQYVTSLLICSACFHHTKTAAIWLSAVVCFFN